MGLRGSTSGSGGAINLTDVIPDSTGKIIRLDYVVHTCTKLGPLSCLDKDFGSQSKIWEIRCKVLGDIGLILRAL